VRSRSKPAFVELPSPSPWSMMPWSSSWVRAGPHRRPPPRHWPPPRVPQATTTRSAAPAQEREGLHKREKEKRRGRELTGLRTQVDAGWRTEGGPMLLLYAPDTSTPRYRPAVGADPPWTHVFRCPMTTCCLTRMGPLTVVSRRRRGAGSGGVTC
jgi:hypothetical protein